MVGGVDSCLEASSPPGPGPAGTRHLTRVPADDIGWSRRSPPSAFPVASSAVLGASAKDPAAFLPTLATE